MASKKPNLSLAIIISVLVGFGVSWAGGHGGANFGPVSLFMVCGIVAFAINWLVFIPANIFKTEKYYDLTGSVTYMTVTLIAILYSPNLDLRAKLAAAMVIIWTLRLGSFLFMRIQKDGFDRRFDTIKVAPMRFFLTWTLQGLWVVLTGACAIAIITSDVRVPLDVISYVGIAMWVIGFGFEVVADEQKKAFRANPDNKEKFITTGLWAWCRHPNYFGEILLWTGIAVLALPVLVGWQWVTLISPVFVTFLLTRVSGVSMLDAIAKKRWGDNPDYQAYRERTPVLIPRPPRS